MRGTSVQLLVEPRPVEDVLTVDCIASRRGQQLTVLISNHQVPRSPIRAEHVHLHLRGLAGVRSVSLERIDEQHANPRRAWIEMGSPPYPDRAQLRVLADASELRRETVEWTRDEGGASINLLVPPHSVVGLSLEAS